MKPLFLTIEGLHSFTKRQSIDFRELGMTGLFGIFGATGSGKSSILDAITLALYGEVKRATRGTQGIINSQLAKLEVTFTFEIGILPKRFTYRVERGFRRNKGERDSIRAAVCRLLQLEAGVERILAEGTAAVNQAVSNIIGLNMTDFTRSVVLPQGEFAQFLKLSNAERVQMLERIFALDEYGSKLSEQVKLERATLEQELLKVATVILEQGEVSPELLASLATERGSLENEKTKLWQEAELTQREYQQAAQLWQYQQELTAIIIRETEHLRGQAEINQRKERLATALAAEQLRPYLTTWRRSETEITRITTALALQQENCQSVTQATRSLQVHYQELETAFGVRQPELLTLKGRLEGLLQTEQELTKQLLKREELRQEFREASLALQESQQELEQCTNQSESLKLKIVELEREIAENQTNLQPKEQVRAGVELEKEYQRVQNEQNRAQIELTKSQQNQAELEQTLQKQEIELGSLAEQVARSETALSVLNENKPGDLELLFKQNQQLHTLEQQLTEVIRVDAKLRQETETLCQAEQELQQVSQQLTAAEEAVSSSAGEFLQAEQSVNQLELELKQHELTRLAASLVTELRAGTPCPVCGATEHPQPAHFELNHQPQLDYQAAVRELERVRATNQQAKQAVTSLQTELQLKKVNLENLRQAKNKTQAELTKLQESLPSGYREVASASSFLASEKERLNNFQAALTLWEEQQQTATAGLSRLKEQLAGCSAVQMSTKGKLTVVVEHLVAQQSLLASLTQINQELHQKYQEAQTNLQLENFALEYQRLVKLEAATHLLRKTCEERRTTLQEVLQKSEALKTTREAEKLRLGEIEVAGKLLNTEIEGKEAQLAELTQGRKVTEVLQATLVELAELSQEKITAQSRYEASRSALEELLRNLAELEKELQLARENFRQAELELTAGLTETGFATAELAEQSLLELANRNQLQQEIQVFETIARDLQLQIVELQTKLAGRSLTLAEWESVQAATKRYEVAKEELLAKLTTVELKLTEAKERYQKVATYQSKQRELAKRKSLSDELARVLQGNALVSYLAEEQLRYILQDASLRLGMLTNQRYQLELGEQKDFAIRDNINGGMLRPAGSLSGGETFLVSLALALALSSQIQLKGTNPLEFFFLDEGFGTLDPRLLEIVMDSLEKLRQGNLLIGVISHVPELKERISRRLFITPAGLDGSGSQVVLNKA